MGVYCLLDMKVVYVKAIDDDDDLLWTRVSDTIYGVVAVSVENFSLGCLSHLDYTFLLAHEHVVFLFAPCWEISMTIQGSHI